ncbi:Sec34-domain-containing protein [Patellaria atrata CBS 101060]|uniref:Conserved oligomeric Golgi complex subunit 3 n=1 Tax=Patellaria atrata CBS 101060 TaxID=1346257 RepID=A0A9P4VN40_9PEZI|nr:Sec34-domain-containing protein [Patellaria atrata CBS 101060]
MYEDAWYNALIPKSQSQPEKPKHRRRESLLKQPSEGAQTDTRPVETITDLLEDPNQENGPPQATVARRAKSYSDFYDVVRAHIKKERGLEKQKKRSKANLKTDLDFSKWYNNVSEELVDASHEEYRRYRDQLQLTQSHLNTLLEGTASALELLSSLSKSFKAVEAQTSAFQTQCEGLVTGQQRTTKLADDIAENLQYYTYLEPITRRLNAPGAGSHVRSKDFAEMLSNLDSCLDYMQAHPNHSEASIYQSRYRLLLTRGLTLIRVHATNALREIAADVSKRIAERQLNDTTMSALLYAKFRVGAADLKQLGLEIQKRAVPPIGAEPGAEAEYQSLMNELHQSYSATRGRLILPIVTKKMSEIAMAPSISKDLVAFARSSISYIRGICYDEYDLWGEWFYGDKGLYDYLESIMEPMYDHLRPRTIHETQLLKLCELSTLIQTRYLEEEDEDNDIPDPTRLDFSALIQPALQDAQTRLVFLALAVLRDDIERYKPKPEDLDYPARNRRVSLPEAKSSQPVLSGRKLSSNTMTPLPRTPMIVDEEESSEFQWNLSTAAALEGWYPTLRKAIWLLSKIYRLVNSTVFDDLAHQIVHQTTLSLHYASAQISTRASPTDGQLFLLKHLLILKQQIVAFDIEFVTPEVSFDFSSVSNTFWELRERGGLFNPGNLVRLVGGGLIPRVVENMLDAKVELDGRLRTVISDFTNGFATRMTNSISATATSKKGFDANQATRMVRDSVEKETPFLRRKLDEYLDDVRTKETLVGAVQDHVAQLYENFYDRHVAQVRANGKPISKKGKGREDEVWDVDTFTDFCARVFNVGSAGFRGDEDEGDGVSSRSPSPNGST